MLQKLLAGLTRTGRNSSTERTKQNAGAISLPPRSLAKAIDEQSGSDVSIQKTPALSSALHDYFHNKEVSLIDSATELLSFSTPSQLKAIGDDISSLGSRGVALESAPNTFFCYGSPALKRYLKTFGIELSHDEAVEFLLNLGRAIKYTMLQLPSHLAEVIDFPQFKTSSPALKRLFIFTAEGGEVISPNNIGEVIRRKDSPFNESEFREQLSYELETLIDSSSVNSTRKKHWRIEETSVRNIARHNGTASLADPYACLQVLHDALQSQLGREQQTILPPSFDERMIIAQKATDLFFTSNDSSMLLSDQLQIPSGEIKDA